MSATQVENSSASQEDWGRVDSHVWHCKQPLMGRGNVSPCTVQHGPRILDKEAEKLDRFGEHRNENERDGAKETSPPEAPHEEEVEEETMDEDSEEEVTRAMRRKMRMWIRRVGAIAAWSPCRKVLALPIITLIGTAATAAPAGPSSVKQRMRRMVPSGNFQ